MKKRIFGGFLLAATLTTHSFSQVGTESLDTNSTFLFTEQCVSMTITPALIDLPEIAAYGGDEKEHEIKNNLRRQEYTNADAFPHGDDPLWQKTNGKLKGKAPIQNWEGNGNGAYPPDPSGAVGPDHYVQMINSEYIVYDKTGTILAGPNSLASLIGSDAGDPIVLYDRFADRWLLSGFGVGNQLAVAISTTPDPLGTYYLYTYNLGSFPDYPKYGLWHDGYYVTSNTTGADCFVFERDKMLVGDMTASMIAMSIPSLTTGAGTETGAFHSVMPAHADFEMPPSTKKLNLFYFQDDAWTGISDDAIKIWEVTVDWDVPGDSDIDLIQTVNTTPFDSQFNISWDDIEQPGTTARLDGVPGAFMYRAQYTEWDTHNTILLNHTVDVDATNHAGIRWYELRETSGTWGIHQEGTYAPDDQSRWMASLSMDNRGNIGMAYAISGSTIYPSIRYTGRYATDPLGEMTIEEVTAIDGTTTQVTSNRFGDYAHMTVDPTDNSTFWYTGEYLNGGKKTRIFSFKLAEDLEVDFNADMLIAPASTTISFTDLTVGDPDNWEWEVSPASGWLYAGGTSATTQNPQILFNDLGLYTIQLTASNDLGSGTETKEDYIRIINTDGIVENTAFGLSLKSKETNIYQYVLNGSVKPFTVKIHDTMGKLIYQKTINPSTNQTEFTIDLSNHAMGYYLLHVSDTNNSTVEKLIVH